MLKPGNGTATPALRPYLVLLCQHVTKFEVLASGLVGKVSEALFLTLFRRSLNTRRGPNSLVHLVDWSLLNLAYFCYVSFSPTLTVYAL